MGSRGAFLPQGGFSEPLKYQEIGQIEGVKALRFTLTGSQKLPERANTADAYIENGRPKRLRVFEMRIPLIDVDFGRSHRRGLSKNDFHVHEYVNGARSNVSRALTLAEWRVGGKLSRKFRRKENEKNGLGRVCRTV